MSKSVIGMRVKEFRTRNGLTQEALAEDSGVSYRTIQRIENGVNTPNGETLKRIAFALEILPEELSDWELKEDKSYLVFFNLSALTFIIFPLLGILIPFIMWTSRRGKVRYLEELGKKLINFQITWTLLLVILPLVFFVLAKTNLIENANLRQLLIFILVMYGLNAIMVSINSARISLDKMAFYFTPIKFI